MALIVITIRDMEDGSCSVQLTDEPRCVEGQTEFSAAQHIGAAALNAIHQQLNGKPRVITDTAAYLPSIITDPDGLDEPDQEFGNFL